MKTLYSLRHLTATSRMSAYRKIKKCLLISIIKSAVVIVGLLAIITSLSGENVHTSDEHHKERETFCMGKAFSYLGIPYSRDITEAFITAERVTGIDRYMLVALAVTESGIRGHVSSNKGYRGIMQIPVGTVSDGVNILAGAGILSEKIEIAGGDILKAIALYKGYGRSKKGLEKAEAVITVYKSLLRLKETVGCV